MEKNRKVEINTKPEKKPSFVRLERLYKDIDWKDFKNKPVIPVGADTMTNNLVGNIETFANFIVAGKKDSGKSTFLHSAIVNLLKNTNPNKFKMILVDLDKSGLEVYKEIPNLYFPVTTDPKKVRMVLDWCTLELSRRFQLILECRIKKVEDYTKYLNKEMPRILVIVSGCSDLIKKKPKYYRKALLNIARLGGLGSISLLLSTSEISEKIYPKKFLDRFYKVALAVGSAKESKAFIGVEGAEKLKGKGDGIFKVGKKGSARPVQCFFISQKEIRKTLASIKQ